MSLKRNILAGFAAGALVVSQSAAAAVPSRAGAEVGASEELGGVNPSGMPAIALIIAALVIFGIMALTNDDDGFPESP